MRSTYVRFLCLSLRRSLAAKCGGGLFLRLPKGRGKRVCRCVCIYRKTENALARVSKFQSFRDALFFRKLFSLRTRMRFRKRIRVACHGWRRKSVFKVRKAPNSVPALCSAQRFCLSSLAALVFAFGAVDWGCGGWGTATVSLFQHVSRRGSVPLRACFSNASSALLSRGKFSIQLGIISAWKLCTC